MARIPDSEIERLKNEVSVERLVEVSGIELKKSGKDLLGCCPFHEDDTASLIVTPAKNLWHCFGCGIGGGPIDWVMQKNGISFRHAVELLREGISSLAAGPGVIKQSTVRKLTAPVSLDANDQQLLNDTITFYHERLKQTPAALKYLQSRGLTHPELIDTFKLGFADRTLGLRLPDKRRLAGEAIRTRLEKLGILRESGHEHFNGSLVIPVFDESGNVAEVYGRKLLDNLRVGTPKHLYLPGPHQGVWNIAALHASKEIILCEALIDAMTFWCADYRNVTASYGVEGFTDDHLNAFKQYATERVLIAYDRDAAGDAAAQKLSERLMSEGIDCYRIQFPKGMDANEYALKVTPAEKSLGIAIRKAAWMGKGAAPAQPDAAPHAAAAVVQDNPLAAIEPMAATEIPAPSLAASPAIAPAAAPIAAEIKDDEIIFTFGDRRYRVRGLPKNLSPETLKINLLVSSGEAYYVDTLDLYSARSRNQYLLSAAQELAVQGDLIKHDLGRILMKLETLQDERIKSATTPANATPAMTDAEREAALALLRAPDLLDRIVADFDACGLVGERTNKLLGYLAAVSRKLDRPLAVVVQSSSAAGKSSLMDAVLALMPEEERIKYSAMTGQSLFYMGETNLQHKILAIVEEEGASRASYALKLLQSEGELMIASTGKDPNTGNLITQEYRVSGPVMIFLTTTAIEIDEELMNRCIVLSVDEGRSQTEAIHALQRNRRTLPGLLARHGKEAILTLHRNAQRLLRPLAVVNPYADQLTFLSDKTRTRRDHEKYLTLIDTIALLHQYQRTIQTTTGGASPALDYIEVSAADIGHANRLAHDVLGRSLDELPPQTRRLLAALVAYVAAQTAATDVRQSDLRFSRRDVRSATGWGDTQLKIHLARLAELEYVLVHRAGRGQGYVYELLYDGQGDEVPHLSGLLDIATLARDYDGQRSGPSGGQAAPGRASVGGMSAPGRAVVLPVMPLLAGDSAEELEEDMQTAHLKHPGHAASYLPAIPALSLTKA